MCIINSLQVVCGSYSSPCIPLRYKEVLKDPLKDLTDFATRALTSSETSVNHHFVCVCVCMCVCAHMHVHVCFW